MRSEFLEVVAAAFINIASRAAFDWRGKSVCFSSVYHRAAVSMDWALAALESRESTLRMQRVLWCQVLPGFTVLIINSLDVRPVGSAGDSCDSVVERSTTKGVLS